MFNKFNLDYYGETIWTDKGLAQGSVFHLCYSIYSSTTY